MTSIALPTKSRQGINLLAVLIFIPVLLVIAMLAMARPKPIVDEEIDMSISHAYERHPEDALKTDQCLKRYGVFAMFREPNGRVHRFCQDKDTGEIFDQILEWLQNRWTEITKLKPDPDFQGNTWSNISKWLERKGAVRSKGS